MAHADEIKGKIGDNLRASLAHLPLSKQLTTIACDLDLPYSVEDCHQQPANIPELTRLLTELGFSTWLKQLANNTESTQQPETPTTKPEKAETHYETILTEQQLNQWLKQLEAPDIFAFDTETTNLDYSKAEIVGLSFAVEIGTAAYLPLAHTYPRRTGTAKPHRNAGKT